MGWGGGAAAAGREAGHEQAAVVAAAIQPGGLLPVALRRGLWRERERERGRVAAADGEAMCVFVYDASLTLCVMPDAISD